ncbi:FkbM family methyltransferase, partial [Rhodoplanes sp. SY1]|uniref:FkbM family methyltransferase n=1 Tax=Rhodoplanes sp. SY1 TaxID=3166646 RepID=UPI0038B47CC9
SFRRFGALPPALRYRSTNCISVCFQARADIMGGAARATTPDRGLVFDLGLHEGHDTRFYLDKGFRVVALEANPRFCEMAQASFAGRDCAVVARALAREANSEITFYIRDDSTGWSSLFQDVAERDGRPSKTVRVSTTTTSDLFDTYGVPYYVKCDIEGADAIFVAQLAEDGRLPPFVSIEIDDLTMAEQLRAVGYDRFQ